MQPGLCPAIDEVYPLFLLNPLSVNHKLSCKIDLPMTTDKAGGMRCDPKFIYNETTLMPWFATIQRETVCRVMEIMECENIAGGEIDVLYGKLKTDIQKAVDALSEIYKPIGKKR